MRPLLALLVIAACGPETTSFRTTDKGDERWPGSATYEVRIDRASANVRVWSNGGQVNASDEPMTHVGFEIANVGRTPIDFDSEALAVSVVGRGGQWLPPARFSMVTPLGPARVTIEPGTVTVLDAYFVLPVRPRAVEGMLVHWSLRAGEARHVEASNFVRDDEYPVVETTVPRS